MATAKQGLEPVALMRSDQAHRACAALAERWPALSCISSGSLALLALPQRAPRGLFARTRSPEARRVLRSLVERQQLLEALLDIGDALGAIPGQILLPDEGVRFLVANAPEIGSALDRFGGHVQVQITISLPGGSTKRPVTAPVSALADSALGEIAAETLRLPVDGPDMQVNRVLLMQRDRETDLDRCLAHIDSSTGGELAIRCIGPLPPVSFASIGVEVITARLLDAARHRLGLDAPCGPRIGARRAFRQRLLAIGTADERDLDSLKRDRDLLSRCEAGSDLLIASGMDPSPPLPIMRIVADRCAGANGAAPAPEAAA